MREEYYTCPSCNQLKSVKDIKGYICKECFEKETKKEHIKSKRKVKTIEDIQKAAAKAGMSYGQYVAKQGR